MLKIIKTCLYCRKQFESIILIEFRLLTYGARLDTPLKTYCKECFKKIANIKNKAQKNYDKCYYCNSNIKGKDFVALLGEEINTQHICIDCYKKLFCFENERNWS